MGFDLAGLVRRADDYLRRHIKSKPVRAAEQRRSKRQALEANRRIVRAALVSGASGAAIVGIGIVAAPVSVPMLAVAGGGALLLGIGTLWRPVRRSGGFSSAELADLPGDAEDWLLARREGLPGDCRAPLDRIFQGLGDLQPHLAGLPPHSSAAWEARRLLGEHLPGLVLAWEALPPSAREEDPEVRTRLKTGLDTLAQALDALCAEVCRDPLRSFETHNRFLQSRYRGEDAGLGPRPASVQNRPSNVDE